MESGMKATLVGAAVSAIIAFGGAWLVVSNTQAKLETRVDTIESTIDSSTAPTDVVGLKKDVKYLGSEVESQGIHASDVDKKVESLQIASAQSTEAINRLNTVVDRLSSATEDLAQVVTRLDERYKLMETTRHRT